MAPWMCRGVLTMTALIFTMIAVRYIKDPVQASAETGVALESPLASTTTRVGFGAFPLSIAIFSLASLFSERRRRAGVLLVATVMAVVIVVRLLGTAMDGASAHSTVLFVPEAVMLTIASVGLYLTAEEKV
jgi:hypothetical protein